MEKPSSAGIEFRIRQFEQNKELRFAKVRARSKRPLEKNWTKKLYPYGVIAAYARQFGNYGVLCGHGGLAVPDADNAELEEVIERNLPETFTVKTGGGGKHYYYICRELKKRVVLELEGVHYGEVQSLGQMVVGPGSRHPNGNRYEITNDAPIVEIGKEQLAEALKPFVKPKRKIIRDFAPAPAAGRMFNIDAIPITSVIDISEYRPAPNGELYGPNPWHGSETGMNTWVNPEKNVAYCFRHHAGINVAKAIALNEGILRDCDDQLSSAQFVSVLNVARKKYG